MLCNFDKTKNTIIIDADGCPVVRIAARLAHRYGAACRIVCDYAHVFREDELWGAEVVVVSQGADSADFYIANHISENDLVITQDYGLAAMCLGRGAYAINQDGRAYTGSNIGFLLESRAANKRLMRNGRYPKAMPKRTRSQNEQFEISLRRILENAEI